MEENISWKVEDQIYHHNLQYTSYNSLMVAAANGELSEIIRLHNSIESIEERKRAADERSGWNDTTPLLLATVAGHFEIVEYLILNFQADVNITDSALNTAMILASEHGYLSIVQLLDQHHADIDSHNQSGQSPVLVAVEKGHTNIVEYLCKAPNDLSQKRLLTLNKGDRNAPLLACESGQYDVLSWMITAKGPEIIQTSNVRNN
jgi:ankyrin repeat protein